MKENIFIVNVCKLLVQKYENTMLKIAFKQRIKMPKKGEYVRFKNYESKIMIYVDFESILVPEANGKQNLDESYTYECQNMLLAVTTVN